MRKYAKTAAIVLGGCMVIWFLSAVMPAQAVQAVQDEVMDIQVSDSWHNAVIATAVVLAAGIAVFLQRNKGDKRK